MDSQFIPFTLNIRGHLNYYTRPQVMGIVNVTPDSFYAGSRSETAADIEARVAEMVADGADMIDIGAYSSRPGASEVSPADEMSRLKEGMKALRRVAPHIPVSVDTFRASVAKAAIEEMGADMINDISGGTLDDGMIPTVAQLHVPYILMHMRGNPATMQQMTDYGDVAADVAAELAVQLRQLALAGVADVIIDPGFGFSKTLEQNYRLLDTLDSFVRLFERPLLVGMSRKSMITRTLGITPAEALNGTTVVNTIALMKGASILRVHDVKEAVQTVAILEQLNSSSHDRIRN